LKYIMGRRPEEEDALHCGMVWPQERSTWLRRITALSVMRTSWAGKDDFTKCPGGVPGGDSITAPFLEGVLKVESPSTASSM